MNKINLIFLNFIYFKLTFKVEEFSIKKHFLNKLFENFPINIDINKSIYVEITISEIKKLLTNSYDELDDEWEDEYIPQLDD